MSKIKKSAGANYDLGVPACEHTHDMLDMIRIYTHEMARSRRAPAPSTTSFPCMCVCVYISVFIRMHTHARAHPYTHTY